MEIESSGNWVRASLAGEIDMYWLQSQREQVDRLCDEQFAHVVLDLEAVTFMDSTGLGLIARLCTLCRPRNGCVYVVRPNETVLKALEIVGLTEQSGVEIAETAAKAAIVDQRWTESKVSNTF